MDGWTDGWMPGMLVASSTGIDPGTDDPSIGVGIDQSTRSSLCSHRCVLTAAVMDGFKYAKSHEYVKMDGDVATIGISDFAQSELGDVVYVEVPEVGAELTKGETFGVVESVKAASDVYAPVSGEVVEVNESLSDDPSKVNTEPFEGGWMMKVKVSGGAEDLLDAAAYTAHCEAGGH
jgi:glycine cleavage system H protein